MTARELYFEAVCDLIEALCQAQQAGVYNELIEPLLRILEFQLEADVVIIAKTTD